LRYQYESYIIDDMIDDMLESEIMNLAKQICSYTPYDGAFDQDALGFKFGRHSKSGGACVKTFCEPSLLIVAQGVKNITIGQKMYQLGKSQMGLIPVALPVELHSLQASQSEPFLTIGLKLDPQKISEFALRIYPQGINDVQDNGTGFMTNCDINIINAANRLIMCLSNYKEAKYIAPLIIDEILTRVLLSPIGRQIVQSGFADSNTKQIIKVISWLGKNYSQPVKVADLAKMAYMSESLFYKSFKLITSMSPLQYQKSLRLYEARRLMTSECMEAVTAGRLVGYVSESQFSRDYRRLFGTSPKKDALKSRAQPLNNFSNL
jgi:AraC-like DNA-binding protein